MNNTENLKVSNSGIGKAHRRPRILRSIGAVLAAVIAIFILSLGTDVVMHASGIYPPWFEPMSTPLWVFATTYRIAYGVAGGYIAALLAPDRPIQHALALGVVGIVLSIAGAVATWNAGPEFGPRWYPLALVVVALPCAWVGGKLRTRQMRARKYSDEI